jgi:hypothetical protein
MRVGPWADRYSANPYSGEAWYANFNCEKASDASLIVNGSITAEKIGSSAVTTDKLEAGAVTAGKINVTELSAISANVGLLRTATTGARTEIESN